MEKIKGAIYGLIIGDALGVPYEFKTRKEIGKIDKLEYSIKKGMHKTYTNIPFGTWSDDSAQMLCLMQSLIDKKDFDLKDFSDKLIKWLKKGYMAVDNKTYDCGNQTHTALMYYSSGIEAEECGMWNPSGKGNGALMRVLPIGLLKDLQKILYISDEQCKITHGNITNKICCQIYSALIYEILRCNDEYKIIDLYNIVLKNVENYWNDISKHKEVDEAFEEIKKFKNIRGSGYVVDTLVSSVNIVNVSKNYEEAIIKAIELGEDTDTTAAVAGGLAGAYFGYESIPEHLIENLRSKELVEKISNKFINTFKLNILN